MLGPFSPLLFIYFTFLFHYFTFYFSYVYLFAVLRFFFAFYLFRYPFLLSFLKIFISQVSFLQCNFSLIIHTFVFIFSCFHFTLSLTSNSFPLYFSREQRWFYHFSPYFLSYYTTMLLLPISNNSSLFAHIQVSPFFSHNKLAPDIFNFMSKTPFFFAFSAASPQTTTLWFLISTCILLCLSEELNEGF